MKLFAHDPSTANDPERLERYDGLGSGVYNVFQKDGDFYNESYFREREVYPELTLSSYNFTKKVYTKFFGVEISS